MSEKNIVMQEYSRTINRLKERGVNTNRVSFNYLEDINSDDTVIWGVDRPFIKLFIDYMPKLALKLTGGALAATLRLAEYINYDSNLLSKRGGNPLNNEDIQVITEYTKRTVCRIMDELVIKKIFARVKVGYSYRYFANPYLFNRGKTINKTLEAMFKDFPEFVTTLLSTKEGVERPERPLKP